MTSKLESLLRRIDQVCKVDRNPDIPLHLTLNKWTGCTKARLLDAECNGWAVFVFVALVLFGLLLLWKSW